MKKRSKKCPICEGQGITCSCGSAVEKDHGLLKYRCKRSNEIVTFNNSSHSSVVCKNCDNGRVQS